MHFKLETIFIFKRMSFWPKMARNSPKLRLAWFWTLFLGPNTHESKSKHHLQDKTTCQGRSVVSLHFSLWYFGLTGYWSWLQVKTSVFWAKMAHKWLHALSKHISIESNQMTQSKSHDPIQKYFGRASAGC